MSSKTNQQWGGRFSEATDAFVARFTASVEFDKRLYRQDIQGSIAHARMLAKVGVLSEAERDDIIRGLSEIRMEIERGEFTWSVELEDVHMNIEAALTQKIGITGKKLHTGVRVMIRLPPIFAFIYAMKRIWFCRRSRAYSRAYWIWQNVKQTPLCQALHIYKRPSL